MTEDVTMQAFHDLIERCYKKKAEKDGLEAQMDIASADLNAMQAELMEYMDKYNLTSHKTKFGNVVKVVKKSVTIPRDPEAKAAFFQFLEMRGIKEDILNINSQTLNSFFNQELETARAQAQAEGRDFDPEDFTLPGIAPYTEYAKITLRK